ncbi:unnamed protein product [Macrosiphum euphorbiae]|uniref:Protein ALP1-like n=1 Tax=Macrosiphum euphorbiae TaxID=13131 RepID=A0AAV0XZU8_9HEMI|nr:unnamed protein product [Macrosiphum euphorbiae]
MTALTIATKLSCHTRSAHKAQELFSRIMDFVEIAAVCALELKRRKTIKKKKKYWVHPITSQRLLKGQFYKLHNELRSYPVKFFNFYRMSVKSFDDLLNLIRPSITYQDSKWRKAIPPEERLSVTLR